MSLNRVELARALHDEIGRVRGVSRLGGGVVAATTQYAGGTVTGISVAGSRIEVRIVVSELPVTDVAERVHKAAALVLLAAGDERAVRVVVTDLDVETLDSSGRR